MTWSCSSGSRLTKSDRHIGGAVSQAYSLVLIPHSSGQRYTKLMAFAVQDFRVESQFVTKMELLQNLFQALCVRLGRYSQVLAPGLGRNIVCNGSLFAYQPYARRSSILQSEGYCRGFQ